MSHSLSLSISFDLAICKYRINLVSWHGSLWLLKAFVFFLLPTDVFNVILEDRSIIIIVVLQRVFFFVRFFWSRRMLRYSNENFMRNKLVFEEIFSFVGCFANCFFFSLTIITLCSMYVSAIHGGKSHFLA